MSNEDMQAVRKIVREELERDKKVVLSTSVAKAIDEARNAFTQEMKANQAKLSADVLGTVEAKFNVLGLTEGFVSRLQNAVQWVEETWSSATGTQHSTQPFVTGSRKGPGRVVPANRIQEAEEAPVVANGHIAFALHRSRNWIVKLWLWFKKKIVGSAKWIYEGAKAGVDGTRSFVSSHPFVVYLASLAAMAAGAGYLMTIHPVVGAISQVIAAVGVIAASAGMFLRATDEWNMKSVSGAFETEEPPMHDPNEEAAEPEKEVPSNGSTHPLRAEAAVKMGTSILFSLVALGRLIALMPGVGLAVLVASLVGVGLVAAFTDGNGMASGVLAGAAHARV